jgi:hypothetical protein
VSVQYVALADYLAIALEITGLGATTLGTTPTVDDAEQAVLAIAAGTWSQDDASKRLRRHLAPTTAPSP